MQVVFNGQRMPEVQARIPVTALGALYGEGCFETIALRHGKPRFFDEHWTRFTESARSLGIELALTPSEFREHAHDLAHHNSVADGVLRLSCHANDNGADWLLMATPPRCHPLPASFKVITSDWPHPGTSPLSPHKHNNYAAFRRAHQQARQAGADECLLCNAKHEVVEGSVSNFFWVNDEDTICTPPLTSGALPGIIRSKILALYPAIIERAPHRDELARAKEIFLTNSLIEIMPVSELNGMALSACPGKLTRRVIESFYHAYPE